ncbi:hypothetical protein V12G01_16882 [Vibrio alginolyticus 12G01]|uniref:hypothetical protein n=1 Tax=Vibrio alginolyticus TaxID=663 RepID=UPI0000D5454F|nr:hypothetical protein [Vibrio alginolyticus]EAS76941.1 hypothetical protein V12G01_16882 [Vibrio alginolyticus 12G01]
MSAQIADFNIRFNTETAKFQKDVDYAKKMLRGYTKEAKAANDSNLSLSRSLEQTADRAKNAGRGVLDAAGYVSAGIGAVTGATAYLITQQAQQAREIEKMATVAQVSVEQIQALGYASEQFNISGENMAEILKDVNDKLGDFTENEGGEFADFMENIAPTVGLTIEKLQELSGPDALIAIKTAMDQANVPMKSQIFYLESIANDASALMPLLDNQGQKLFELTKKYDDLNVSMSEYDIEKFKEMDQKLKDTGLKLQRSFANAVLGASDQIDWFSDKLAYSIDYWGTLFDSWSDTPRTVDGLSKKLSELRSERKELSDELKEVNRTFKEYEGIDVDSLLPINPLGRSENELFNLNSDFGRLTKQLDELDAEIARQQKRYNIMRTGMNYDTPQPGLKPEGDTPDRVLPKDTAGLESKQSSGASRLASLDMQYASEREKLILAHEQRLRDIEEMQVSEQELKRRGFDTLEALKAEYRDRETEFYLNAEKTRKDLEDDALEASIESFAKSEEAKTEKAKIEAEKRAYREERLMQERVRGMSNFLSQISELQSSENKNAARIGKTAARVQIMLNAYESASYKSLVGIPYVGPGLAAAAAGTAMGFGISMASKVDSVSNMAHNGISEVPMLGGRMESDWTLKAGERVYTNESANRIDQMYSAIMAMQRQKFAMNEPSLSSAKAGLAVGGRNVVNIYGAPEGAKVRERQGDNGENITDVFLEDLDSDGPMSQGIAQRFDLKPVGV